MTVAGASILATAILLGSSSSANAELDTIKLKHRLAADVAETITPLLEAGETVVARGGLVIVKASPERISAIRNLVSQFDTTPHRLKISVAQGHGLTLESLAGSVGIGVQTSQGDAEVSSRGHLYQSDTRSLGDQMQTIQALEGQPAMLRIGEQIPLNSPYFYGAGPNGTLLGQSNGYRGVSSGFAVTPRLTNDHVVLDIAPWSEQFSKQTGRIETNSAQTVLETKLGEWTELGTHFENSSEQHTGLGGHDYSTRSGAFRIYIRVDSLEP